jgi:hypothetical protein
MDPMEARTPDGRVYKLEDIKKADDPQLLKWFRSNSSAKTKPKAR